VVDRGADLLGHRAVEYLIQIPANRIGNSEMSPRN
jgi:hypothetical protein